MIPILQWRSSLQFCVIFLIKFLKRQPADDVGSRKTNHVDETPDEIVQGNNQAGDQPFLADFLILKRPDSCF
jgi:hypothetical protein